MRAALLVGFVGGLSLVGLAQEPLREGAGGPFARPPVIDAPFSADATTTIRQTRTDGTVVEWTTEARYYRDSAGRVRVDQTMWNPDARVSKLKTTLQHEMESGTVYVMEPSTKTARRIPRGLADVVVLYRVSNIDRAEPSADLFVVPSDDYKSVPVGDVSFHFPPAGPKTED